MRLSIAPYISGDRPIASVPKPVIAILLAGLLLQLGLHQFTATLEPGAKPLPAPVAEPYLNVAGLGEPVALSKLLMLWIQAYDHQPGISIPFSRLNYNDLIAWLDRVLFLDPSGHYPLLSAARIYSEVPDEYKKRQMLDFVYKRFLDAPDQRWQWLAHAIYVAKHKLHDMELALHYARELRLNTSSVTVPDWAWQMELFVLEDLDDLESARILLGGLIASGEISDPKQIEFLTSRLEE
jgi:hypothetical protein